jgi:hypothetical protein
MLISACLKRPPLNTQLLSFEAQDSSPLVENKLLYPARWQCERSYATLIVSMMGTGALRDDCRPNYSDVGKIR